MYNVSANFHTLSIQDAPNTRVRIYFIGDGVDCTDDNDVTTNGTLLVGAVGDTDSNRRISQDGITITEIFNKESNLAIGDAVSYQIDMTLMNTDGALNNFAFGRCKVYLDVYDSANSAWLPCPIGVFIIELPTRSKGQLVHVIGYDQMQKLDAICDSWWSGLNWNGGITLLQLVQGIAAQVGASVSSGTSSETVNSSLSYGAAPFKCAETTYRDVLEMIAEATGTIARFDRDGALDLRWFKEAQIGGNTVQINTDAVGNQCLEIELAGYQVAQISKLLLKNADGTIVSVGSGTNQYTVLDNKFLNVYDWDLQPAFAIGGRLSSVSAYKPIQTKMIWDWSIETGDIIKIVRDSTTYAVPIFQQTMVWRGGYVVSTLGNSGNASRPIPDRSDRAAYQTQCEMNAKVGVDEIISKINQSAEAETISASKVDLSTIDQDISLNGDVTINSIPDVVDRRCYDTLTSAGWYRILTFNADSQNQADGYSGLEIDLHIGTNGANNERHGIKFLCVNGNTVFTNEVSKSRSLYITKIRYTYGGNKGHIDIRCEGTSVTVSADYSVCFNPSKQYQIVSENLTGVGASPTGETVATEYSFSATSYYKQIYAEGTSNGWDYVLYTDKTIDATRKISDTVSSYTTVNGFAGYYIANIATPFTMANADYYIGTEWAIGNGFAIPAAIMSKTTTKFNAYALGTASGSQSVSLTMHLKGTIA